MENKVSKHLSHHRVGYLMVATILTVGTLTFVQSVPNFRALDNTALTGNVGQLNNVSSSVSFLENNLASTVLTTGDAMEIQWQSLNNATNLYLVPVNTNLRPITIEKNIVDSDEVKSFEWQVPAGVKTGDYYLGLSSGGYLDKTDRMFTVIQTLDKQENGVSALQSELNSTSKEIQTVQTQLEALTTQISSKNQELSTLKRQVQAVTAEVNKAVVSFQSSKSSMTTSQYKAATQDIYRLNTKLSEKNLSLKMAEANLATLESQAQSLKAKLANNEAKAAALQGKIIELQGTTDLNLNASLTANNISSSTVGNGPEVNLADLNTQIETKQEAVLELKSNAETLSTELKASQLELSAAEEGLKQAMAKADELTISLQNAQTKVNELNRKIASTSDSTLKTSLEKELQAAQNEVSSFQELLITAQAETQAAQTRLSTGKKINSAADNASAAVQVELNMAEAELSALTSQSNLMETELKVSTLEDQAAQTQKEQLEVISTGANVTSGMNVSNDLTVSAQ